MTSDKSINKTGVAYLIGAGELFGCPRPKNGDLVIAADGGYDSITGLGITPHLIIGDMDSVKKIPNGIEIIRHKVQKDETDMHLAFLEGYRRGYRRFEIYGGTGGRPDHTFANYCLLLYIAKMGCVSNLIGNGRKATVIRETEVEICGKTGGDLSVFAFGSSAKGVTIDGALYTAFNIDLDPEFPLGTSNSFLDTPARISVKNGALLIIYEVDTENSCIV